MGRFGPCLERKGGKAVLSELEWWFILQNFVPKMWEFILYHIPIEWRVINMNNEYIWHPLCSWWPPVTPYWLWWSIWGLLDVLWNDCDGVEGMGPWGVPWACPESSAWFPYAFLQTVNVLAVKSIYNPTFLSLLSLSLGAMRRVLMVLVPLKCTWIPKLFHILLNLSPGLWMYGTTIEMFLLFDPLLLLGYWVVGLVVCPLWMLYLWLNLFFRVLRAHDGKLQGCRIFPMFSISLCSASWLVQTTLALNAKVLKTLFIALMKQLLSQCRYWSVCVGFL